MPILLLFLLLLLLLLFLLLLELQLFHISNIFILRFVGGFNLVNKLNNGTRHFLVLGGEHGSDHEVLHVSLHGLVVDLLVEFGFFGGVV